MVRTPFCGKNGCEFPAPPPAGAKGEDDEMIGTPETDSMEITLENGSKVILANTCRRMERRWIRSQRELAEAKRENASLLDLIYKIRAASGDPHGKLMLDELAPHIAKLRADLDSARTCLSEVRSDLQCTIDQYNANGPQWTSRESGAEYYDASFVVESAREKIAKIDSVLPTPSSEQEPESKP